MLDSNSAGEECNNALEEIQKLNLDSQEEIKCRKQLDDVINDTKIEKSTKDLDVKCEEEIDEICDQCKFVEFHEHAPNIRALVEYKLDPSFRSPVFCGFHMGYLGVC